MKVRVLRGRVRAGERLRRACAAGCCVGERAGQECLQVTEVSSASEQGLSSRASAGAPEPCEGVLWKADGGRAPCSGCLRSAGAGRAVSSGDGSASARLPARRHNHILRGLLPLPQPAPASVRNRDPGRARRKRGAQKVALPRARSARVSYAAETPGSSHGRARRPGGDEASTAEAAGVRAREVGSAGDKEARETREAGGL